MCRNYSQKALQLFPSLLDEASFKVAQVLLLGKRWNDEPLVSITLLEVALEPLKVTEPPLDIIDGSWVIAWQFGLMIHSLKYAISYLGLYSIEDV